MENKIVCSCILCHDTITTCNILKHYERCIVKGGKFVGRKYSKPISLNCSFCTKLCKNENSLRNHEIRCFKNPNSIKFRIGYHKGFPGKNQYTKAKEQGLPKPSRSERQKKAWESLIKSRVWDDNERHKQSIAMKNAVLRNPDSYSSNNVCGRCKLIEYKGILFHGTWEVEVAKWLDDQKIQWIRNTQSFDYLWNERWHLYFPDFYLPNENLFIEVKGYETHRDHCKWEAVDNLLILRKEEIKKIKKGISWQSLLTNEPLK